MPHSAVIAGMLAAVVLLVAPAGAPAAKWTPYDRPATNGTTTDADVPITMSDGIRLRADVHRPDTPGRYPVIITQTPYNKQAGPLGGFNEYLVRRGYVQVIVDVRGTGSSEGQWDSFGPSEQRDGAEVVAWARRQPWSDGKIGLFGPSYMAITQLTTAARRPKGLKALFTIVPMADGYRDIVFSGGQINVSFIPLWLGLVTGGGLIPPSYAARTGTPQDLVTSLTTLASHVAGVPGFQLRTVLDAAVAGDTAFDGPFWKTRSPIELLDRIRVPTFVAGGHHDLFQRGEPLIYERLKRRVTSRLLMGPWTHLTGSSGDGLPADGVPSLDQIALRWFDRYLKDIDTDVERIPKVTQYTYGRERYETQPDWPHPRLDPLRLHLRAGGQLSPQRPPDGEPPDSFVQHPVSGICSQSTSQWSAGLTEQLPCTTDDRLNESGELTYTTAPMVRDLRLSGPLNARLWVATSAADAVVSVKVTDVAPDGRSRELTGGWLAASFRAVDESRSRYVRGKLVQPWHPFTRESILPVRAGEPMALDVEVFPANAVIRKGHRLRVSVGPSDFPHAVPPLPQFVDALGGRVQVLHDAGHPSALTVPVIGHRCAVRPRRGATRRRPGNRRPGRRRACRPLPLPDLTRAF